MMPPASRVFLFLFVTLWTALCTSFSEASEPLEGRFSFSLSTFDPSGKLGQVERAILASTLGTPIVAVVKDDRILLAAPQILPSPFLQDDGTSRFCPVTPQIALGHTGIAADGRVLVAAAQRLAVEHAYTYDENIPIDLFLEEVSLLYQEYTMKEGARPFGATLLVAHVPGKEDDGWKPQLFRIDPSGSVVLLDDKFAIINGNSFKAKTLENGLLDLAASDDTTIADERKALSDMLQEVMKPKKSQQNQEKLGLPSFIIAASMSRDGLQVERTRIGKSDEL